MMQIFNKIIDSIRHAFHGLKYAYKKELSFHIEVWAGIILIFVGYIAWPLAEYEILFLVLSYIFILALELINTAIERMCARLHPEHHEMIGTSKDLASSAVLMGVVFATIVAGVILVSRFVL